MSITSSYSRRRHDRFKNSIEDGSDSYETDNEKNSSEQAIQFSKSLREPKFSTLNSLMESKPYSIVVGIEITNWTKYHLTKPKSKTYSGYISTPAVSVRPGNKEAMIAHKHGYTMTGSSGIVSWLIQDKEKRLVVVWKSPYFLSNSFGICLTTVGIETHKDKWITIIRNNQKCAELKYKFSSIGERSDEIMIEDDGIQICGSMGSSSKPEVKITLRST